MTENFRLLKTVKKEQSRKLLDYAIMMSDYCLPALALFFFFLLVVFVRKILWNAKFCVNRYTERRGSLSLKVDSWRSDI